MQRTGTARTRVEDSDVLLSPRRVPLVLLAATSLVVATVGSARAVTAPADPAPDPASIVAPVESATRWLEGPIDDATDPEVMEYAGGSGIVQVPGRAVEALGRHSLDEAGFRSLAQDAYDSLLHMRPDTPLAHSGDTGQPAYTPDWDGDGSYGEAEDYDRDVDAVPDTARFRYPCTGIDGVVTFERVGGGCGPDQPGVDLATGVAREVRIVDSRGFVLDATVWLPGEALLEPCTAATLADCADPANVAPGLPSVVFHNGLASRQEHYYWWATSLARAGYAVLTYDPAGQGESEGTAGDLMSSWQGCSGSCLDAQDAVRWWLGQDVLPLAAGQSRPFAALHDPRYVDAGGDNVRNPYRDVLDGQQLAISGNSMGAAATVDYLNAVTAGAGYDGRPLPAVAAAVPMSIPGETRVTAPAPTLMVTGDLDGVPLVAPAPLGLGWADDHERMYRALRQPGAGAQAVGLVVIEGGVHTDHVDQPLIASTRWGIAVTERYAIPWLDCYARGLTDRCASVTQASPHLSRAFASQVDPDGAGPASNVCIQAPDRASLGQEPQALVDALLGDHAACES